MFESLLPQRTPRLREVREELAQRPGRCNLGSLSYRDLLGNLGPLIAGCEIVESFVEKLIQQTEKLHFSKELDRHGDNPFVLQEGP